MKSSNKKISRRQLLKGALAATTAGAVFPQILPRRIVGGAGHTPPSETLNVVGIGAGMMGMHNMRSARNAGMNILAVCEVDEVRLKAALQEHPNASLHSDYRRVLEDEGDIDAVIVSTPDHTHATISMAAMELGNHVYCEKPLAHSLYETRVMTEAARKYGIASQLGNHGHSFHAIREFRDCVWSGEIGEVREIHVVAAQFNFSMIEHIPKLKESHPLPDTLDWDLWLGPAAHRDFHPLYQGPWRGWRPFGSGMLGDYMCHIVDPVFWALNLGAPTSVVAEAEGFDLKKHIDTFPAQTKLTFEFPARDELPPVTLHWHDGKKIDAPELDEIPKKDPSSPVPGWAEGRPASALVIGSKGSIIYGPQGAMDWTIVNETQMKEYMGGRKKIKDPRWPDNLAHFEDWKQACMGWDPAGSNFDYGGPLTEVANLGNIAHNMPGTKLDWDSTHMTFPNQPQANQFLHSVYREGWTL